MAEQNYYEVLELAPDAPESAIRKAYRELARRYHPDTADGSGSDQKFQLVNEAYRVLSDPDERASYDLRIGLNKKSKLYSSWSHKQADPLEEHLSKRTADWQRSSAKKPPGSSQGQRTEMPSGFRFSSSQQQAATNGKDLLGLLSKLRGKLSGDRQATQEKQSETPEEPPQTARNKAKAERRQKQTRKQSKAQATNPLQGERYYHFTVNALESISGATRELALKSGNGTPRMLRVRIPAGVNHEQSLTITTEDGEYLRIKVSIEPHALVERDRENIILKFPVTIAEALVGVESEIPVPGGSVRVKVPPMSRKEKLFRLTGRGVTNSQTKITGDLFVKTYIVPPEQIGKGAEEAAKAIDSCYLESVRKGLPKEL